MNARALAFSALAFAFSAATVWAADQPSNVNHDKNRPVATATPSVVDHGTAEAARFSVLRRVSATPMTAQELSTVRGAHSSAGIAGQLTPAGLGGVKPTLHPHLVVNGTPGNHPPSVANDQVIEMGLVNWLPPQVY